MVDICLIVVLNTSILSEPVVLISGTFLSFSSTIHVRYLSHSGTECMYYL